MRLHLGRYLSDADVELHQITINMVKDEVCLFIFYCRALLGLTLDIRKLKRVISDFEKPNIECRKIFSEDRDTASL